ncbi:MAG TPA: YdbL family protein [Arsenophonus sp.]
MKKYILPVLLILISLVVSFSALNLPVTEVKQPGLVGETLSGYLAAVVKNNAEVDSLVNSINHAREQKYAEIAQNNQLKTEQVAKIAGQKLIDGAKKGEYVLGINGRWIQK